MDWGSSTFCKAWCDLFVPQPPSWTGVAPPSVRHGAICLFHNLLRVCSSFVFVPQPPSCLFLLRVCSTTLFVFVPPSCLFLLRVCSTTAFVFVPPSCLFLLRVCSSFVFVPQPPSCLFLLRVCSSFVFVPQPPSWTGVRTSPISVSAYSSSYLYADLKKTKLL